MFNLFSRNRQLLDEEVINWIFDTYDWAFKQFDQTVFFDETDLVLPTNQFFPGEQNSVNGMASLIFEQVKQHAGMSHWPTELINVTETEYQTANPSSLTVNGQLWGKQAQASFAVAGKTDAEFHVTPRKTTHEPEYSSDLNVVMSSGKASNAVAQDNRIKFVFHPQQLNSPEGLIAHFAQGLAQHLVRAAESPPPGGKEYLPIATELMGVFMGFGVIFANSAVVPRTGGCGGCGGGQSPVREVVLNQDEATYALALFCQLKSIHHKSVSKYLKKHLRGFFKAALSDCQRRLTANNASSKRIKAHIV